MQQLGRGLRKAVGKEFVVILDFIGAYTNNYMIPIALSGDRSYNKDNIRRYVQEGSRMIPGCSTIYFDEISRKRIFSAIDSVRPNDTKLLCDAYRKLNTAARRSDRYHRNRLSWISSGHGMLLLYCSQWQPYAFRARGSQMAGFSSSGRC